MAVLDGLQAAEADADDGAGGVALLLGELERRVAEGDVRGRDAHGREAVELARLALVREVGLDGEVPDLARDLGGVLGGVEVGDGADRALAGEHVAERLDRADAVRDDETDARDDDALHVTFLKSRAAPFGAGTPSRPGRSTWLSFRRKARGPSPPALGHSA